MGGDILIYVLLTGRVFLLEEYQQGRGQSSSVSPGRNAAGTTGSAGGYCSSASTPHSSNGGSYSATGTTTPMNGYGNTTPTSAAQLGNMLPGSPTGIFNSATSKFQKFFINIKAEPSSFGDFGTFWEPFTIGT